MQFELTTEILEQFRDAVEQKNDAFLKEQLHELHAADIAVIFNQLEIKESSYIYDLLEEELAADVLLEMDDDIREELLATFSTKEIAEQ
ncbi:MAG: magnesium transporter MgtE N-terminal domain-containing protein, partial [Bacteroidia bacterium]